MTMPRIEFSRRQIMALSASALGLSACGLGDRGVLRSADAHPDGYPTLIGVQHMADMLHERSGGRYRLKIYGGGQLGQEKDTLEITVFGGLDFNRVNLAPLNSIVPETLVPTLPFMFRSIAHMRAAMDGAPGQTILNALESHGMIGLCFYDSGARSFYTTGKAIETPDDLRGLKIRVQNSDLFVSTIEALGGDATPMTFGEVYQGLLQGVVDGAENNWPSYESTRHFEAAPFYSLTRHVMAPEVFLASARSWSRFSEDDQILIRSCARDSVAVMRAAWDARVEASKEIVQGAGVTITEPDTQPFQEKVRPVWDRYLTSPSLQAIAEDISAVQVPDV